MLISPVKLDNFFKKNTKKIDKHIEKQKVKTPSSNSENEHENDKFDKIAK